MRYTNGLWCVVEWVDVPFEGGSLPQTNRDAELHVRNRKLLAAGRDGGGEGTSV